MTACVQRAEIGERGGVLLRVGEKPELFELIGVQQVGLIDREHDAFAPLRDAGGAIVTDDVSADDLLAVLDSLNP